MTSSGQEAISARQSRHLAIDVAVLAERLSAPPDAALCAALAFALWPHAAGRRLEARLHGAVVGWDVDWTAPSAAELANRLRQVATGADIGSEAMSVTAGPLDAELRLSDGTPAVQVQADPVIAGGIVETLEALAGPSPPAVPSAPPSHRALLRSFNNTARPYAHGTTITTIVDAHTARAPDAIAVQHGAERLSYGALAGLAAQVAGTLQADGLERGDIVPVLLERELALVWVLLGILKAGGAYAVLDPAWPAERLRRLAETCAARRVVARRAPPTVRGAVPPEALLGGVPAAPLVPPLRPDDPCCVFFTSGTTAGRPKGVLAPHVGTVRAVVDAGYASLNPSCTWLQAAALPWDGLTLELWGALLNGGRLVLSTERPVTPSYLRSVVADGVNTLWLTASLFNLIVEEDVDAFAGLQRVLVGGERLSPAHVRAFCERHPRIPLTNGYGPAEATVFATTHRIGPADLKAGADIPLGRCLPNTRVHVVREGDGPAPWVAPIGAAGEICVAGHGLGAYLESDSDRRFVEFHVDGVIERIYRTGDIGAWRPDGKLTFAGRADRQVKLRGHRVELTELEAALAAHPAVTEAAVVVTRGSDPQLLGFVRVEPGSGVSEADVRRWLAARVPGHARPQKVFVRHELPRGVTGKLDRVELLRTAMAELAPQSGVPAAARGAGDVCAIASELLGVDVPPDADLFELGATSLTATRLAGRLRRSTGREIAVNDVLRERTPRRLRRLLDARPPATAPPVVSASSGLSHAQRRFWIAEMIDPGTPANLVISAHHLDHPPALDALAAAVGDVARRHAQLRTVFAADSESQRAGDADLLALEVVEADGSGDPHELAAAERREPFDLERSAARFRLTLLPDGSALLTIAAHHIVIDGWSEMVVLRDLARAYEARLGGRAGLSGPAPADYGLFVADEAQWLQHEGAEQERRWWCQQLRAIQPLPATNGPPSRAHVTVPRSGRRAVPALAAQLTALSTALHAVAAARGRVGIGVVVSGRRDPRFEQTVGVFINTICVPAGLSPEPSRRDVHAAAAVLDRALAHDRLPFDEVVAAIGPPRTGRHPLCQVLLVSQEHGAAQLALPGCPSRRLIVPEPAEPFDVVVETWATPEGLSADFEAASGPADRAAALARCWTDTLNVLVH